MSNNRSDKINKKTLFSSLRSDAEADLKSDSLTEAIKRLKVPFSFNNENKHPYAYANVLQHVGLSSKTEYLIASMGGQHLQFHRKNVETLLPTSIQDRAKFFKEKKSDTDTVGWKLHISVSPRDIDKAWSIILPILLDKKISGFKIIDPRTILDAFTKKNLDKIGNKQFTIYQFYNTKLSNTEWNILLQDIDNALREADIKPANPPLVDNKIQGSEYFSYRNDTHPNNPSNRIDPDAAYDLAKKDKTLKSYNLINAADPFENITLGDQPTFTKG